MYTWTPGYLVEEGAWKFESLEEGKFFRIIEANFHDPNGIKYLCDERNGSRGKSLVSLCNFRQLWWKLVPVYENNKAVYVIKRVGPRRFFKDEEWHVEAVEVTMFAGGADSLRDPKRRKVFTMDTKANSVKLAAGHWDITC